MSLAIVLIIFTTVGIGFLVFFIVRSLVMPKRVDAIANLVKRGKTQPAIRAAKQLLAKDQHNAEAHYHLGQAYLAENSGELALGEYKIVNQLGIMGKAIPEEEFRKSAGQLYYKYNQAEEALKEYLLLLKLAPKKSEYYYWAGKLFAERNRGDMAGNYLRKAAELNPREGKIHFELGAMLYREKKAAEAKSELETALKYQSDNAQAHFYLGKLQKDAKDHRGALESFEKAARDPQYRVRALVERGGCYMALNAIDKAIPDLERAANAITSESAQESLYCRYFLAMCYEKARNLDRAIGQWEKISAVKKNFKDVAEKLAQYQDLRADDNIKDYFSSSQGEFIETCKALANQVLDLTVKSGRAISDGCELIAIENDAAKWKNVRKAPRLLRFFRSPDMVDEAKIREILEDAKNQNMPRSAIFTSSGFSSSALEYANSRPVELFNKEKLQELLGKIRSGTAARRP
ncbi:MAG: tetratricopeptide repeat protein [Treponema sp.]|jgi:tetratricopeptide (TPR) repeat protein|nr:tetratricopeptide repeat protein [Treponema sp.]